jgi:hypothetical protein
MRLSESKHNTSLTASAESLENTAVGFLICTISSIRLLQEPSARVDIVAMGFNPSQKASDGWSAVGTVHLMRNILIF